MMPSDAEITIAHERAVLLSERALYLPDRATLLAADVHLGKAATFRALSVAVPGGTTSESLGRLTAALDRTRARRLIVLGDLLHGRRWRAKRTLDAARRWRERHAQLEIVLVRGNHDARAGDPPDDLEIACCAGPLIEPPFAFRHEPEQTNSYYTFSGHVHPAVVLVGAARQRERLPCFLLGDKVAILPAFGAFTGTVSVAPTAGDRVFVIAGDEVIEASRKTPHSC